MANIYITGEIGETTFKDLVAQVQNQKEALSYNVFINSIGGYVDTGFEIYDYLKSLNKPIHTIGYENVMSIATVIFLAGDTRKLKPNTQFMVHNPSGGVQGTAQQIDAYNVGLKDAEKRIIKFYSEKTGLTAEAITPLLSNETFLTIDEALSLGFSTLIENEKITASFKINNNNNNDKKMNEDLKSWFVKQLESFGLKAKAIKLQDENGTEIDFPSVEEGLAPSVGDAGTIDNKPVPDGTYIMPSLDNASVMFVGGVITEITPAVVEDDSEAIRVENENLKKQILELTAKNVNTEKELLNLSNDISNFKQKLTAKFELEKQEPKEINDKPEMSSRKKELLNKIK